jgi:hypothetical protein
MSCRFASYDPDEGRCMCSETECQCMFLFPNEKECYKEFGEGPLAFEEDDDDN